LGDGVEHRKTEMRRAAFARRGATDHLGAVGDRLLGMEGAVLAREALADDLGVLADEDAHGHAAFFTAATIFCAASSRSSPEVTLSFDSAMIFLPSSTFVPSRRTTSATFSPTSFT